MPYRRGYVPPLPDFSKTGMSYSTEEEEAEEGPRAIIIKRKSTKKAAAGGILNVSLCFQTFTWKVLVVVGVALCSRHPGLRVVASKQTREKRVRNNTEHFSVLFEVLQNLQHKSVSHRQKTPKCFYPCFSK